ncbi:MAG: DUF4331 domain-containing protein [Chloroflexota bacterium]
MRRGKALRVLAALTTIAGFGLASSLSAHASSHREAPLIAQDPQADNTDLYAFVSNNDAGQKVLNILANYIGFEDPGGGPNYATFSDDVRYEIHVENDATVKDGSPVFTGRSNLSYYFQFKTRYAAPGTFLTYGVGSAGVGPIKSVGDGYQNLIQTYTVTQVDDLSGEQTTLGTGTVPPPNTGHATPLYNQNGDGSMPARQGAATTAQLDPYTQQAIATLQGGVKAFAGPRLDPFYADVQGIFDLLSCCSAANHPKPTDNSMPYFNTLGGYDVHEIALQIPVDHVATGKVPIVGVYASASRRAVEVRPAGNGDLNYTPGVAQSGNAPGSLGNYSFGPWRQVSRLGNPLDNEVLQGIKDKDRWNQTSPAGDASNPTLVNNADCPQLAGDINLVFGLKLPACGYKVLDYLFIPDLLKVDTSTGPVRLESDTGFSRLTNFGGDTINSPFQQKDIGSGWPLNGRRLGDDVVTLALTAIASGPTLSPLTVVTDNVDSNGLPYNHVFPFEQTPANGWLHHHVYP